MMKTNMCTAALLAIMSAGTVFANGTSVSYPDAAMAPGKAEAKVLQEGGGKSLLVLGNQVLSARWEVQGNRIVRFGISNSEEKPASVSGNQSELFRLSTEAGGFNLPASSFVLEKPPVEVALLPEKGKSARASDGFAGKAFQVVFHNEAAGLVVTWRAELRDGSSYVKETFDIKATKPVDIKNIQLVDLKGEGFSVSGTVPGSPLVGKSGIFAGVELPVAKAEIGKDGATIGFACNLPMQPGAQQKFSAVFGVYPKGQLRRGFLAYLERERAMPYTQFLQYNCWYDFGLNPTEEKLLATVKAYGDELGKKRGIKLDSFVLDDGWDDVQADLWQPSARKFPSGFRKTAEAIRGIGSNFGIWISPLGGYTGTQERINHAKAKGLLPASAGKFDLAQPEYYKWFRDRCADLMVKDGVNFFKWDKAGEGVSPHFMALLSIANELRAINPKLFLSTTVGTWPSPFWLNHVDCTWRDGSADVGWQGKGDDREQSITYRDAYCYSLIVQRAPLYPLSSLMHHGLVLGTEYQAARVSKAGNDLKNDARMLFGSGANLQELYLTASMMNGKAWDDVAEAVRWARKNAEVLADVHWVGGNPHHLDVYGYAAWSPAGATLALRNPDDKPKEVELDAVSVFEPVGRMPEAMRLHAGYADQRVRELVMPAEGKVKLTLQPFEVLVFDARFAPKK
ncbi:alpha-galactosidase [Akkermansia glycaniphila]|nr:alpha-galactosidase [Akkermansia glycaniphila]